MVVGTTGMFPTEFDSTIDALCATLDVLGVSDVELHADQQYVFDLIAEVGDSDPSIPFDASMKLMDLMFIGLIYHRHMPFLNADRTPVDEPHGDETKDIAQTLGMLSRALSRDFGVSHAQITEAATEGGNFAVSHLGPLFSMDDEHTERPRQVIALVCLGLLVHRFIPHTPDAPKVGLSDEPTD